MLRHDRITPAGAGKTKDYQNNQDKCQDHPRRCGENFVASTSITCDAGSPPQVRGKPSYNCEEHEVTGITPAGAGKTVRFLHTVFALKDHPRRCGENAARMLLRLLMKGSPPQVRGKLAWSIPSATSSRITPAGAGKTVILYLGAIQRQDHPRRCGENVKA